MDGKNPTNSSTSSDRGGGVPRKKPRPRRRGGGGGGRGTAAADGGGDSAAAPTGTNQRSNSQSKGPPPSSSVRAPGGPRAGGRNKKNKSNAAAKPEGKPKSKGGGGAGGLPPVPQLKVLLRGIGSVDRYGTCEQMAGLLRALVNGANQQATSNNNSNHASTNNNHHLSLPPVVVDEVSIRNAIDEEAAALQAKVEWLDSQDPARDRAASSSQTLTKDGEVAHSVVEDGSQPSEPRDEAAPNQPLASPSIDAATAAAAGATTSPPTSLTAGAVDLTFPPPSLGPTIVARVLYMVPPKKTRRRGDKPGCLYVVLHMPWESITSTTSTSKAAPAPPLANVAAPPAPLPSAREAAKRRHLLARLVEVWSTMATDDAKAGQVYAGVQVGEAPSGRAWKTTTPHPQQPSRGGGKSTAERLDGTLWETPDYKSFVEAQVRAKEERMARPKPPPGGAFPAAAAVPPSTSSSGATAATASGTTTTPPPPSQPPVAALVRHMLAKHEAHKDRFKASAAVRRKPPPTKQQQPPPPVSKGQQPAAKGKAAAATATAAAPSGADVAAAAASDGKAAISRARRKKNSATPGSAIHQSKSSGAEGTITATKR